MLILASLYTLYWVSLIAGVGYRVEQWGGKWDRTMGVANFCIISTVVQGCASYYVSRALTSPQRTYEHVQCWHTGNVGGKIGWNDGFNYNNKTPDNELATVPCLHGYIEA